MCVHMHKQKERMEPNHKDVSDDNRDFRGTPRMGTKENLKIIIIKCILI